MSHVDEDGTLPPDDDPVDQVAELLTALEQHRILVTRYATSLRRIADPEVFDANWAAMRIEAREALGWEEER
jgi:hypothetical protein